MRQRIIEDFQRQLFRTCGIRTLVLTAYEGEEHDLRVGMYVLSDAPSSYQTLTLHSLASDDVESILKDGKSFLKFCPEWKNAALWEEWVQFGVECFSDGLSLISSYIITLHTIQIFLLALKSRNSRTSPKQLIRRFRLLWSLMDAPFFLSSLR